MGKNHLEAAFVTWLRQSENRDLPACVREYQFHPTRLWRLDFAWPDHKVAVEIDGLVYDGRGGHQTVAGVLGDCEKYEAALLAGWRLYRVPGPWISEGDRWIWRVEVMDTLRALLNDSKGPT